MVSARLIAYHYRPSARFRGLITHLLASGREALSGTLLVYIVHICGWRSILEHVAIDADVDEAEYVAAEDGQQQACN
jgi:hypothetical protein